MTAVLRRIAARLPRGLKAIVDLHGKVFAGAAMCAAMLVVAWPAQAQIGSARYSSIIVDNSSGRVLEQANADSPRYPASLTKLMTLYMAFEALRDHRISLDQTVPVSAHAASMEPTKLGVRPGSRLTVQEAILALVTLSANDAASALGELMGGDEDRFAQMMTLRARGLGMTQTTFRNASGLPDDQQVTTARDLALLAHRLIADFPDQYHYFSEPVFYFHRRAIPNHDRMLKDYEGADGLKTGYINASGHNLVTSAMRGGVRLIGVVMGARTNPERDAHMASLLDDGFEQLGVPVSRRTPPRFRMPSLIASAEASTLSSQPGWHARKLRHGHLHLLVQTASAHRTVGHVLMKPTLAAAHGPALNLGSRHMMAAKGVAACTSKPAHHGCTFHAKDKRKT